MMGEGIGYVRVPSFDAGSGDAIADAVGLLAASDPSRVILDVRNNATGVYSESIAAARRFVADGTLAVRREQGDAGTPVEVPILRDADLSERTEAGLVPDRVPHFLDMPLVLLTNFGTAGPAELFVAALTGRDRADAVGQRTAGRASEQKLVRLPDGTGLWLSWGAVPDPRRGAHRPGRRRAGRGGRRGAARAGRAPPPGRPDPPSGRWNGSRNRFDPAPRVHVAPFAGERSQAGLIAAAIGLVVAGRRRRRADPSRRTAPAGWRATTTSTASTASAGTGGSILPRSSSAATPSTPSRGTPAWRGATAWSGRWRQDHGGPDHSRVNLEMAYPELLRAREEVPQVVQFFGLELNTPRRRPQQPDRAARPG